MPVSTQASPWYRPDRSGTKESDVVLLFSADQKRYLVTLARGATLHTHLGAFAHDDMLGRDLGDVVYSQLNNPALLLEPSLNDMMAHLKRVTQIVYPKDAAWLVHRLNLHAGSRVIEAGTGSGALTTALAWAVAPAGMVYSYEARPDIHHLARRSLERSGLLPFVHLHLAAIDKGFEETEVDALFLDVRDPWRHLPAAARALRRAGFFASLVPTTNQVTDLLNGLEQNGFVDVTVEEVLLRGYKPVPERLRPEDSMVAHTGYLAAARYVGPLEDPARWQAKERQRYRARLMAQERIEQEAQARAEEQSRTGESGRKYPRLPLPG